MHKIIFMALLAAAVSLPAHARTDRKLTDKEKKHYIPQACEVFTEIFKGIVKVNQDKCLSRSHYRIVENDPNHGTYLYGVLYYSASYSKDCNFKIDKGDIIAADCSDE